MRIQNLYTIIAVVFPFFLADSAFAFEGRIRATLKRGGETQTWLYTVSTNALRIERGECDHPYAGNMIALGSGAATLIFPHNRSFVRLRNKIGAADASLRAPADISEIQVGGKPRPTALVAGTPRSRVGLTNLSGMPAPPVMPQMPAASSTPPVFGPGAGAGPAFSMPMTPAMPTELAELEATGQITNLLGYSCSRYELKHRGEIMEIWATDRLLPFEAWLPDQPPHFSPRATEELWPELLKSRKLFPLLATLKFENGAQPLRFEVKSIKAEKIEDTDGSLFQPPPDYQEIEPLPF